MPDISILTPILNPQIDFLKESYVDISNQDLSWEWIIYWDGPATTRLPDYIVADKRVRIFEGERQWGIAITRNRALMEAEANVIHAHDYDDRLMRGSLKKAVDALVRNPAIAYTCGHWDDLCFRDGSWVIEQYPENGLSEGILPIGWKHSGKIKNGKVIAPPPGSYTFRRLFLEAYGGWGALSVCEDAMVVSTIRARHEGYYLPGVLGLYRKHLGNTTNKEEPLKAKHQDFVKRRISALKLVDSLMNK